MLSSAQCLAKAVQMDAQALQSETDGGRNAYASLARSWRGIAVQAGYEEAMRRRLSPY